MQKVFSCQIVLQMILQHFQEWEKQKIYSATLTVQPIEGKNEGLWDKGRKMGTIWFMEPKNAGRPQNDEWIIMGLSTGHCSKFL